MVFSDLFFLFVFLPAFACCYLMAAGGDRLWSMKTETTSNTARNAILTLFSLIFYAWGEPVMVFLMLGCVVENYSVGLAMEKHKEWRKLLLGYGVAFNLGLLGVFKYAGFITENLQALGLPVSNPHISLPIGISFYIFQSISYLVDVYRGETRVQRNFLHLLLYISMFPQLIAGPIVRYGTVAKEISDRKVTAEDFADGLSRFIRGLAKKVIIANQLWEVSNGYLTSGLQSLTIFTGTIGILAFALQIYFDFSGYSDMAIGIGRCLGFHYNENFRHPYCCTSITDFWRRWHISLGSFFRDYVYIPLGGNRRHQAINILAVWFLTGLWHGASWNFVIWGLYFGVIVTLEKYTILKVSNKLPLLAMRLYSMAVILFSWTIFYYDDTAQLAVFYHKMFSSFEWDPIVADDFLSRFWLWVIALVFCMPAREWIAERMAHFYPTKAYIGQGIMLGAKVFFSLALLLASVALLVGATNNAFIYTRF